MSGTAHTMISVMRSHQFSVDQLSCEMGIPRVQQKLHIFIGMAIFMALKNLQFFGLEIVSGSLLNENQFHMHDAIMHKKYDEFTRLYPKRVTLDPIPMRKFTIIGSELMEVLIISLFQIQQHSFPSVTVKSSFTSHYTKNKTISRISEKIAPFITYT